MSEKKLIINFQDISELAENDPVDILASHFCRKNITTLISQYNERIHTSLSIVDLVKDINERMQFGYFIYTALLWGDITVEKATPDAIFAIGEKIFPLIHKTKHELINLVGDDTKDSFIKRVYDNVERKIGKHDLDARGTNIQTMYRLIKKKFEGKMRGMRYNGEPMPYVTHPKEVFLTTLLYSKDVSALKLLLDFGHDLREDTPTTQEELNQVFGPHLAFGVEQLTKRSATRYLTEEYGFDPEDALVKRAKEYLQIKEEAVRDNDPVEKPSDYETYAHIVEQVKHTRNTKYLLHLHGIAAKEFLYFDLKTLQQEEQGEAITQNMYEENPEKYGRIATQDILEVKFADTINNLSSLQGKPNLEDRARKTFEAEHLILPLAQEKASQFAKSIQYWIDIWQQDIDKQTPKRLYEDRKRKYFEELPLLVKTTIRAKGLVPQYAMETKIEGRQEMPPHIQRMLKMIYVDMRLRRKEFENLSLNDITNARKDALDGVEDHWNETSYFFYHKDVKPLMKSIGAKIHIESASIDALFTKFLPFTDKKNYQYKTTYGINLLVSYYAMLAFQAWKNDILSITEQENFNELQQKAKDLLDKRTYTHDIQWDRLSLCLLCHLLDNTDSSGGEGRIEEFIQKIHAWRLKNPASILKKCFKDNYLEQVIHGGALQDTFGLQIGWLSYGKGSNDIDNFLHSHKDLYVDYNDRGFRHASARDTESISTIYPFINIKMKGKQTNHTETQHLLHPIFSIEQVFNEMRHSKTISISSRSNKVLIKDKDRFWHTLIARANHFNQKIYKIPSLLGSAERSISNEKLHQAGSMDKLLDVHIADIAENIYTEVVDHRGAQNTLFVPQNENISMLAFEDMPEYVFYSEEEMGKLETYSKDGIVQPFPIVHIQGKYRKIHLKIIRKQVSVILRNLLYQLFGVEAKKQHEQDTEEAKDMLQKKIDYIEFIINTLEKHITQMESSNKRPKRNKR